MRTLLGLLFLCACCGGRLAGQSGQSGQSSGGAEAADSGAGSTLDGSINTPSSCGAVGEACCTEGGSCKGTLVCSGGVCAACVQDADCGGGGTCTAGRCLTVIARNESGPYNIAVDGTNVYWENQEFAAEGISPGQSTLQKAPLVGGAATTLATFPSQSEFGGAPGPFHGLAVRGGSIYWTSESGLLSMTVAGGTIHVLWADSSARAVRTDASSVYWTAGPADEASTSTAPDTVSKMPLGGGAPTVLASSRAVAFTDLAVGGTDVYWTSNPLPMLGTPGVPYPAVLRVPLGGGNASQVDSYPMPRPPNVWLAEVAVSDTNVYWFGQGDEPALDAEELTGGAAVALLPGARIADFVVDGTTLYWADIAHGSIVKESLSGGGSETLYTGDEPTSLAVDGTSIYWVSTAGGTVSRLSPK